MKKEDKWALVAAVVFFLVVLGIAAPKPYFEAKSFNRCTGGNASYMDALTTELRVDSCKRSSNEH